jgi:hypothetical protein
MPSDQNVSGVQRDVALCPDGKRFRWGCGWRDIALVLRLSGSPPRMRGLDSWGECKEGTIFAFAGGGEGSSFETEGDGGFLSHLGFKLFRKRRQKISKRSSEWIASFRT